MAVSWLILWCLVWLAGGRVLWVSAGLTRGAAFLLVLVILQVLFVRGLRKPCADRGRAALAMRLGILSAGAVGALAGVAGIWAVLVFRGNWETPLATAGGLTGLAVLGVTYCTSVHREDEDARSEALAGLLFAIGVFSLGAYALAKLSLATTHPDWLFRFPRNQDLREIWSRSEWLAGILFLWALGGACLARVHKAAPPEPTQTWDASRERDTA